MAKTRPSHAKREREFKKRERDRKKQEKAALKRLRRHGEPETATAALVADNSESGPLEEPPTTYDTAPAGQEV